MNSTSEKDLDHATVERILARVREAFSRPATPEELASAKEWWESLPKGSSSYSLISIKRPRNPSP